MNHLPQVRRPTPAIRSAAVAGRFYPAGADELRRTVDGLLAAVTGRAGEGACVGRRSDLRALIVPHAGYPYSGPVAATGYACLRDSGIAVRRVVLLGPAHYVRLDGMACAAGDLWRTPLGDVPVEQAPGVPADDRPHAVEHALEVQLPFLQRLIPGGFTVVPIAVGRTDPGTVADLLDVLDATMPGLVVVSTDLSHHHDADTATGLDRRTVAAVTAGDAQLIGVDDACGSQALRGLVEHARRHHRTISLLDRRTSADTAGDPGRVVGYASLAVTDGPPGAP
jgi:AmmeMemoRadiSam system protein B